MNEKLWVQYKNDPQGEKWEVVGELTSGWAVKSKGNGPVIHYLPKSEYRLCAPPEQWEEVPVVLRPETYYSGGAAFSLKDGDKNIGYLNIDNSYRVKSLVIERRMT